MSLANFSWPVALLGLSALAVGLFLLHRLRVRHRDVEVPTTLFWREAVEDTRARVLVRRFRHPLTYLLLLGISSLLWLAAGGLRGAAADERDWLLVLDGSAGMAHGERFAEARELLLAEAAELPAARREVWWSGAQARLLLRRGEHARLLAERLDGLAPEAAPAQVEQRLLHHVAQRSAARALEVRVYGDAPLREGALDALPIDITVVRRMPEPLAQAANQGILTLGVAEAGSGAWDRVDVLVGVAGDPAGIAATLDGVPLTVAAETDLSVDGYPQLHFRDLPARGQVLELRLPADAFPLDDRARLVLPDRPPLRVAVSPSLAAVFAPLLDADPALLAVTADADVVVRRAGEALGSGLPALEFAPAKEGSHAILVRHDAFADPGQLLQAAYDGLGLAEIDALSLAQELQRPVTLGVETDAAPTVVVWDLLLDPASGFPATRSFPLLLARSLRWLSGAGSVPPYAEAGRPLAYGGGAWRDAAGARHDAAGGGFVPVAAGEFRRDDGARLWVSLHDAPATLGTPSLGLAAAPAPPAPAGLPAWNWLVLLAFALLLVEWLLFQGGRIP